MLYILTSILVLRTANAGRNMLFQNFCNKKQLKEEKVWICGKIQQQPAFDQHFDANIKMQVEGFITQKTPFPAFWCLYQNTGQRRFFPEICNKFHVFSFFFQLFSLTCWKSIFWPAFVVRSTQMLVKIHNTPNFDRLGNKPNIMTAPLPSLV